MITDNDILARIRPELATDASVVRSIDGSAQLQRVLRNLPKHWELQHIAPAGAGMIICVFNRNPEAPQPGDFDYFEPTE